MSPKPNIGSELIEAARQMVAIEKGEDDTVHRVHRVSLTAGDSRVPEAPQYSERRVSTLRARMRLSQPLFAQALNVSPETVRAWEQGKRRPDGAALRLLHLAEPQPDLLLSMVKDIARTPYKAKHGKQ